MKNNLLVLVFISAFAISCSKEDDSSPKPADNTSTSEITAVPSTFKQKVLIETFTGAGQPQCPDGFVKMDNLLSSNSTTAIPVMIHYSDGMEIPYYTTLETTFSNNMPPTFPSAMINRTQSLGMVIFNRTQWQSNFDVAKQKTANCGLAIKTSVTGNTATVEVHCGFKNSTGSDANLTVYLTENDVSGNGNMYDQRNSYNTTTGHPYANLGDPIINFDHNYVLRKVVSAALGDAIPTASNTTSGEYVKTYTVDISGYKADDLQIVAFISKTGTSATTRDIYNVQKVKLGSIQNWD